MLPVPDLCKSLQSLCIDQVYTTIPAPQPDLQPDWTSRFLRDTWRKFIVVEPEVTLVGSAVHVYGTQILQNSRLFTHDSAGACSIWDTQTMKSPTQLVGHQGAVTAQSTMGEKTLTSCLDKTVRLWDLNTAQCERTLNFEAGLLTLTSCAVMGDDRKLRLFDLRQEDPVYQTVDLQRPVFTMVEQGETLFLGGYTDGIVRLDMRNLERLNPLPHKGGIAKLALIGRQIVSSGFDKTIRVYTLTDDSQVRNWGKQFYASALKVDSGGRVLVSGHADGSVYLWDPENNKEIGAMASHTSGFQVSTVDFDESVLVTAGQGGQIALRHASI